MNLQNKPIIKTVDGWINIVKWDGDDLFKDKEGFAWYGDIDGKPYGNWVVREPTGTETDEEIINVLINNARDTKKSL